MAVDGVGGDAAAVRASQAGDTGEGWRVVCGRTSGLDTRVLRARKTAQRGGTGQ